MGDQNATPQPGPAPDSGEMGKEKKNTPLTMEEMSRMHIGAGSVQPPAGAGQNTPGPSQEADWVMKAGDKIGKGLAAVGKGISNGMDAASSAVESVEKFLNDCACEVSSWDWGCFDILLDVPRGYCGEEEGSPLKYAGAAGKGIQEFATNLAKGTLNLAGHPVETAKGIGYGVTHLPEVGNALREHYWGNRKTTT